MTWCFAAMAVFALLPLVVFRGAALRRYLVIELVTYGAGWLLRLQAPPLDSVDAAIFFFVAKLAVFCVFLATADADEVRWSANRAALIALLVYAIAIPAMLRTHPDGDEPYYLLMTESLVADRDLDLANQYADMSKSATRRPDLKPFPSDPRGPHGEQYSRHEPFLPLLMVPGYLAGKLGGAMAVIALFGVLLARSFVRMLEDEAIPDRVARAVFPFVALAPPVLFYSLRIWPEVPAAFFFVEAVRGVRQRRAQRWIPALFGLVLLKLRFVLVAFLLVLKAVSKSRRHALIGIAIIALPLLVLGILTGRATNVHRLEELVPGNPLDYVKALFGLALDGTAGIAFRAPFFLLGLFALTRWRSMPETFRLGMAAVSLYVFYLLPRPEWHGGWSPPLRYIVIVMPILALGAAAMWERIPRGVIAIVGVWTIGLVAHGLAYPWRLFHIANGENAIGEWLSVAYRADFSRLFPSFIRLNDAAWIASIALVLILLVARFVRMPTPIVIALAAVAVAAFAVASKRAGRVIEFEDIHVVKNGGDLHPDVWAPERHLYRAGWLLDAGQSISFLANAGQYELWYSSATRLVIELDHHAYELRPTAAAHRSVRVDVPSTGRIELRCVTGRINLDRMVHVR